MRGLGADLRSARLEHMKAEPVWAIADNDWEARGERVKRMYPRRRLTGCPSSCDLRGNRLQRLALSLYPPLKSDCCELGLAFNREVDLFAAFAPQAPQHRQADERKRHGDADR